MPITPQARDLAIRTLLGEAGSEPLDGMYAVANVMKNRADSGAWGDPSNGGLTNTLRAPAQFSTWNTDDPKLKAYGDSIRAIPTTDPNYQRAGAIVDQVFNGQVGDNTGGATHFYAPAKIATPDWAVGKQGQRIGNQNFYKLPLSASNTAGTAITSPSLVGMYGPMSSSAAPDNGQAARAFLSTLSAHTDRAGDTANLNPEFATRLAAAVKQARNEGLPVSIESAYRTPGQTGSVYDAGGNSSHSYGLAADIAGLDGANGKVTQRWAQIAQANGLSNPYGISNGAEFNHWQLPPVPLEQTPQQLAALKAAAATGDFSKVWAAYQPGGEVARPGPYMPTGEAPAAPAAAAAQPIGPTKVLAMDQLAPYQRYSTPPAVAPSAAPATAAAINRELVARLNPPAAQPPAAAPIPTPPPRPPNFGDNAGPPAGPAAAPRYDPLSSISAPPSQPAAPAANPGPFGALSPPQLGQGMSPDVAATAQRLLQSLYRPY